MFPPPGAVVAAVDALQRGHGQDGTDELTPTQRCAMDELFATGAPRPRFDPALGRDLRAELDRQLAPLVSMLGDHAVLSLNKGELGRLHTCEGLWLAQREAGFSWSAATARGAVAHKAVELAMHLPAPLPDPLDLVEMAVERIIVAGGDWGPREWLLDAPAAELAELRGAATDWVIKFQDTFPPLQRKWRPRVESSLTVDLCGSRVLLRGKVDLALGRARGDEARVLIVDFKTGLPTRQHVDDLRFYALLETIRVGVPPFRLATFSLDSGRWHGEDVDAEILTAAARRVVAGAAKLAELETPEPRAPTLSAGPFCRWCPARRSCPAARQGDPDGDDLAVPADPTGAED